MRLQQRMRRLEQAAAKLPCPRCRNIGLPLVLSVSSWPKLTPETVEPCPWCGKKREVILIVTPRTEKAMLARYYAETTRRPALAAPAVARNG